MIASSSEYQPETAGELVAVDMLERALAVSDCEILDELRLVPPTIDRPQCWTFLLGGEVAGEKHKIRPYIAQNGEVKKIVLAHNDIIKPFLQEPSSTFLESHVWQDVCRFLFGIKKERA